MLFFSVWAQPYEVAEMHANSLAGSAALATERAASAEAQGRLLAASEELGRLRQQTAEQQTAVLTLEAGLEECFWKTLIESPPNFERLVLGCIEADF